MLQMRYATAGNFHVIPNTSSALWAGAVKSAAAWGCRSDSRRGGLRTAGRPRGLDSFASARPRAYYARPLNVGSLESSHVLAYKKFDPNHVAMT